MPDVSQVVFAIGRLGPDGVVLLGTAFAVSNTQVATAYHVVGADDRGMVLVAPRLSDSLEYQDTSDTNITTVPLTLSAADPVRDLCVLSLGDSSLVNYLNLSSTDHVPTGGPVVTVGFPHANYGRMVVTQQHAHVGARILIASSGVKNKHIVLNTQTRDGQSGGPVLDVSTASVIAVVLGSYAPGGGGQISLGGIDPLSLHQTTHAISAEYLRGML